MHKFYIPAIFHEILRTLILGQVSHSEIQEHSGRFKCYDTGNKNTERGQELNDTCKVNTQKQFCMRVVK